MPNNAYNYNYDDDHEDDDDVDTAEESSTDYEDSSCGGASPVISKRRADADNDNSRQTNEDVLNFAFLSFVSFLMIQAVFALMAHSQAMLADCEAMAVDALTYLFNLWAERAKTMPLRGEQTTLMNRHERAYHRELRHLYLELIPPAISCSTLIGITMYTLRDAFATLLGQKADDDDDVSVVIMMIFSSSNLLLDIVNVTCFARSSSLFGLQDVVRRHSIANAATCPAAAATCTTNPTMANETTPLIKLMVQSGGVTDDNNTTATTFLPSSEPCPCSGSTATAEVQPTQKFRHPHADLVNLNMCSAWTVRHYLTERWSMLLAGWPHCSLRQGFLLTPSTLCVVLLLLPVVASFLSFLLPTIHQHVCADTLRSTAVLIAAAVSFLFPASLSPSTSDAAAAVAVSIIILASLLPLLHCLVKTALAIHHLRQNPPPKSSGPRRQRL